MAWDYAAQIHSLTGFDADSSSTSEEGTETYQALAAQWLTDAAKEVINILPPKLKEKCITESTINNSPTTLDLDAFGEIFYITRLSADSDGVRVPCRKVQSMYGELTGDSSSLHYATVTDPVYWISSSSDTAIINVNPAPTANQTAIVYHVGYPSVVYNANTISNFPDEAEYLVPLRAAITAVEYKLNFEEDAELYMPMLSTLKVQYQEGVLALQTGSTIPKQQGKK